MKQKYYLIVILGIILISGCVQYEEREIPKFNISIYWKDDEFYKTVEISNLTLPIDSEQEAYELWTKASIEFCPNCTYNFTEQPDYWSFDNWIICPPDLPYPCGGGCTGKINKINGNIEDLMCAVIA